jgi:hypothetical protein
LNPSGKFQNFLFIRGLNLSEIGNLLKSKSLYLNFILEPSQFLIFWKNFNIFFIKFPFFKNIQAFIWIHIQSQIQISSILRSSVWTQIILGLRFKILWFESLNQSSNSCFWRSSNFGLDFKVLWNILNPFKSVAQNFKKRYPLFLFLFWPKYIWQPISDLLFFLYSKPCVSPTATFGPPGLAARSAHPPPFSILRTASSANGSGRTLPAMAVVPHASNHFVLMETKRRVNQPPPLPKSVQLPYPVPFQVKPTELKAHKLPPAISSPSVVSPPHPRPYKRTQSSAPIPRSCLRPQTISSAPQPPFPASSTHRRTCIFITVPFLPPRCSKLHAVRTNIVPSPSTTSRSNNRWALPAALPSSGDPAAASVVRLSRAAPNVRSFHASHRIRGLQPGLDPPKAYANQSMVHRSSPGPENCGLSPQYFQCNNNSEIPDKSQGSYILALELNQNSVPVLGIE